MLGKGLWKGDKRVEQMGWGKGDGAREWGKGDGAREWGK